MRTMPTRQPVGWMMLKSTKTTTVKPAWPAANEIALGAYAASRTANGSTPQSTAWCVPIAITMTAPTTIPTAVPASALRTDQPVLSALERRTESVPSTTQNECCKPVRCEMNTATANPTAPRMLLRNHTERMPACETASCVVAWIASAGRVPRSGPPLARTAYSAVRRAEYELERTRNAGSSLARSSSSSGMLGSSWICRTRACVTASRATASLFRSGSSTRPSSRAAPARSTEAVAAIASAFSSRHNSSEPAFGTRKLRSQSSSSTREASAAVGPVGPVVRCGVARKRLRRLDTASRAAAAESSRASFGSARSASARHARAASSRSAAPERGGQSSRCARIPANTASAHPSRRAGRADIGAAIDTGKTNVNIAAVAAAAKYPLITPENRIAKPTTAIAAAASHGSREHNVPMTMFTAPTQPSRAYAANRVRAGPLKSARTSIANDPNAAKMVVCGLPMTWSANAKTAGITIAARAAALSEASSGSCSSMRLVFHL
jgi:hypothetical protein